jgi:hypothetical protein
MRAGIGGGVSSSDYIIGEGSRSSFIFTIPLEINIF